MRPCLKRVSQLLQKLARKDSNNPGTGSNDWWQHTCLWCCFLPDMTLWHSPPETPVVSASLSALCSNAHHHCGGCRQGCEHHHITRHCNNHQHRQEWQDSSVFLSQQSWLQCIFTDDGPIKKRYCYMLSRLCNLKALGGRQCSGHINSKIGEFKDIWLR